MFISLQELEQHTVPFALQIPAGEIDFDGKVTESSELRAEGVAELLQHSLADIRVAGDLDVVIQAPCDRCLEAVSLPIRNHFDFVYLPADSQDGGSESEVGGDAVDIGFYEGNGLALHDVLREVVLLALPMQLVCGESCKGICPVCGQNRNQGECSCHAAAADDRWNKLKELRAEISGH